MLGILVFLAGMCLLTQMISGIFLGMPLITVASVMTIKTIKGLLFLLYKNDFSTIPVFQNGDMVVFSNVYSTLLSNAGF